MNKAIGFVMVGTNDILAHLEMKQVKITERYIGYGFSEDDGAKFYIIKPHNKENATAGNGTMVALAAQTKEAVDKFHKTALENGAIDEGAPGPRSDGNYYGYVRDHDGNKITARCVLN